MCSGNLLFSRLNMPRYDCSNCNAEITPMTDLIINDTYFSIGAIPDLVWLV